MCDLTEYKLKNLLLEKEFTIARANRDLSEAGKWSTGWDDYIQDINKQINHYIDKIEFKQLAKAPKKTILSDISPYEISMVEINDR
nr:hypothetical protein GTC16762_33890 [Pigmentibacter ruber]